MSKGLPKTVKKVSEKLHFYKAWLAMTKGDIMSTSRLQRHFKSHSSIQSSIQSFSLLNLQLQIVTKDNIKIRLILIIFLFILKSCGSLSHQHDFPPSFPLNIFVTFNWFSLSMIFFYYYYIYITPVNNLPLGARKPQRFTNIYNEQYIE